jgi:hypothetical protein
MIPNNANVYLPPVITVPSALTIINITNSYPMIVTAIPNDDQANVYIEQQQITLNVPATFGMIQANGLKGIILDVNGDDISLDVDSRNFDPFINPNDGQIATLSPSGSRNLEYTNNTANHVPFKSLNNRGN